MVWCVDVVWCLPGACTGGGLKTKERSQTTAPPPFQNKRTCPLRCELLCAHSIKEGNQVAHLERETGRKQNCSNALLDDRVSSYVCKLGT